jgi:hypothetical protein
MRDIERVETNENKQRGRVRERERERRKEERVRCGEEGGEWPKLCRKGLLVVYACVYSWLLPLSLPML